MLLLHKSIEFIGRKNRGFCNQLIVNELQNRSFSHYFRQKKTLVDFGAKEMLNRSVKMSRKVSVLAHQCFSHKK